MFFTEKDSRGVRRELKAKHREALKFIRAKGAKGEPVEESVVAFVKTNGSARILSLLIENCESLCEEVECTMSEVLNQMEKRRKQQE